MLLFLGNRVPLWELMLACASHDVDKVGAEAEHRTRTAATALTRSGASRFATTRRGGRSVGVLRGRLRLTAWLNPAAFARRRVGVTGVAGARHNGLNP